MKISVIIPTYNASKYINLLIQSIKSQTIYDNIELIIIDSESKDDTSYILKKNNVKHLSIPSSEFDHGGTRTLAAKEAKGDILIFLTQDALPADEFSFFELIKTFEDKDVAASYGRQIPYSGTSIFGKHLREFNYPGLNITRRLKDKAKFGIKTPQLSNSFCAYRKSALEEIGYFKNNLILGEDVVAGVHFLNRNYKLVYNSKAKVFHSHDYTIIEEFKRYFDIGVFHSMEKESLAPYLSTGSEGGKYIRSEFRLIMREKKFVILPLFIIRNIMKLFGYKMGRIYMHIPRIIIKKISMHSFWWKKK